MRDGYGRNIDYIRISVTDRCNLRCRYCMPADGIEPTTCEEILRFEEILRLARLFADCGIQKVKVTGGEPLVRKDAPWLIGQLKKIPGIHQVTLTTNGLLLGQYLPALMEAGLDGVNISLDTLEEDTYRRITGRGSVRQVLKAIEACCDYENLRVKINTVTLADYNLSEIEALAALAKDRKLDVRFIEMMPMGLGRDFPGYTQETALKRLEAAYGTVLPAEDEKGDSGPAVYYKLEGFQGRIGMISAMSHIFCKDCNRIRLTAEGFLKPCLHYGTGVDLRQLLRTGADDEILRQAIEAVILDKPERHGFCQETAGVKEERKMWEIGG